MKHKQVGNKKYNDCTSLKGAIQQNEHVEEQLKCALEMTELGMWEWSIETDEVFVSDEVFGLTGLNPSRFDGTMTYIVSKIIHPESRPEFMKSMAMARKEGLVRNKAYRVMNPYKEECWVKFYSRVVNNEQGKVVKVIGTLLEITDDYIAKRTLQSNLSFLDGLIETLPTPIYYKNKEGAYQYCNQAFFEFVGKEKQSVIGQPMEAIIPSNMTEMYRYADETLIENKEVQSFEGKIPHRDGSLHTVWFSRAPYMNEQGSVEGLVSVMQDISDQKSIEREVQMLYKAKDVFLNVNRHMMSYNSEKEFFDSIQHGLQSVFEKAHQSTVLQYNDDEMLTILINSGYNQEETGRFSLHCEESFMWRETGGNIEGSLVINDLRRYNKEPNYKIVKTDRGEEVLSTLMIPLKIDGELKWILSFDSCEDNIFDEIDQFVAEYIREELPIVYRMFELYQKTLKLSRYDGLTGLMNRRYFEYVYEEKMNRAIYNKEQLLVVLFDLDGLKRVNDTHGHHAGDVYIKGFVEALRNEFSDVDTFARIGGDEFTGLFAHIDTADLVNRIENVRALFEQQPLISEEIVFKGSFSYGLSTYPTDSKDMSKLLQMADEQMYRDKQRYKR